MFGLFNNTNTDQTQTISGNKRDAFDDHLNLTFKIEEEYKKRDTDASALDKTIQLCEEQIEMSERSKQAWIKEERDLGIKNISLPSHKGYTQLSIIFEKQGLFQEAIKLVKQAKLQGWSGDWDKRIKRCEERLLKANQ
jgi:hypothetical protein